jgi:hypothetical protein
MGGGGGSRSLHLVQVGSCDKGLRRCHLFFEIGNTHLVPVPDTPSLSRVGSASIKGPDIRVQIKRKLPLRIIMQLILTQKHHFYF